VASNEQAFEPSSGRLCKVKKKKRNANLNLCKRVVKRVKKSTIDVIMKLSMVKVCHSFF
jgi:hypothetical protein